MQADNDSLKEELKELRATLCKQQARCMELTQKINPTCIQPIEKPVGKAKISINTAFNLNRKEGQVRCIKSFFGDLIRKNKISPNTTYRTLDITLAENWVEAVGMNFYFSVFRAKIKFFFSRQRFGMKKNLVYRNGLFRKL